MKSDHEAALQVKFQMNLPEANRRVARIDSAISPQQAPGH